MKYKEIEGVKMPASRMVFGTAIPAMMAGEQVFSLLDAVFDAGINVFDSARIYGFSEKILGEWIAARENRKQIILLTKGAHPLPDSTEVRVTPEAIRMDIHASLQMLQTDYIDIYMLHRDDPKKPVGPLVETLNEFHEKGKIGIFGGSNWSVNRVDMANEYAYAHDMIGFSVSSPAYSLAEQFEDPWGGGCLTISGKAHKKDRAWYKEEGIEVFAYATLAHGFLSGKFSADNGKEAGKFLDKYAIRGYCCPENIERLRRAEKIAKSKNATVPQVALAWVLSQSLEPMAIFSASTIERVQENIKAIDLDLTWGDIQYLNQD